MLLGSISIVILILATFDHGVSSHFCVGMMSLVILRASQCESVARSLYHCDGQTQAGVTAAADTTDAVRLISLGDRSRLTNRGLLRITDDTGHQAGQITPPQTTLLQMELPVGVIR